VSVSVSERRLPVGGDRFRLTTFFQTGAALRLSELALRGATGGLFMGGEIDGEGTLR
jgi:hypothetical protein